MDTFSSFNVAGKAFHLKPMKIRSPKITVLMSVYNGEQHLREAVDSILDQTCQDFEFVIINDASNDRTKEILDSYQDPKIIIIHNQKNLGLTKSLNIGLKKARGTYVARMDADDISLPNRLKKQEEFLNTHTDTVCVGGETIVIDESGKEHGVKKFLDNPDLIRFKMTVANQMAHPTVMFRKTTIMKNGGYDENFKYVQDFELWSKLLRGKYRFSNIPEPILLYRYHAFSITQGASSKNPAYDFAAIVIKKNLSHYFKFTEDECSLFLNSFHKHQVFTFRQVVSIWNFLSRFRRSYEKKEDPSPSALRHIKDFIFRKQLDAFQWYAKWRFGILYKIVVKIWKLRTPRKK